MHYYLLLALACLNLPFAALNGYLAVKLYWQGKRYYLSLVACLINLAGFLYCLPHHR